MEEPAQSPQMVQQSLRKYHLGNGTLRGGGLKKVYPSGPTMKAYKRKLDNRLGYCIIGCLITIATILVIFGLFHKSVYEELSAYIDSTRQLIYDSIPTTNIPTSAITIQMETFLSSEEESIYNETQISSDLLITTEEPETCLGSLNVDSWRCLTITELDNYYEVLHRSHIVLWNLASLNIIIALLLISLTALLINIAHRNSCYKIIYRIIYVLPLLFMAVQMVLLISPLLTSSLVYPEYIDKLFVEKLPKNGKAMIRMESRFACQFDYIEQLAALSLQQPCIPQIKNSLFLPYAVILLIIIDALPFLFIVFTFAWDKWIKDTSLCQCARDRIETNRQRRPQSREDILKNAMQEPHYV